MRVRVDRSRAREDSRRSTERWCSRGVPPVSSAVGRRKHAESFREGGRTGWVSRESPTLLLTHVANHHILALVFVRSIHLQHANENAVKYLEEMQKKQRQKQPIDQSLSQITRGNIVVKRHRMKT